MIEWAKSSISPVARLEFWFLARVRELPYHFDYTFWLELGEELRKGLVFRIKNDLSFSLAVAKIRKTLPP